ncbi:zinc ABC transporter ATP-binding protein ZnuC [Candidatus Enterovibrio altilux]|uniref:Zinc ABC transporter, ATP-binding protein ZnuC n=1 Tax=Candidatus Enterovibrio altilux TaxID=1927128 RepID=A0A291B7Q7_9GAMM|nr:zinc ABC transporter ATP-binding protein ZnuC [Candidatus Enterovibrio luxaltus]ATF09007.1 Zinc ABC transporter, ATP-binding protein ZnuC [Candidatus Enterovibrio luxaltus]
MSTHLVTLHNVSVIFNGRSILDKVAFSLYRGKITTLIGPNGAGKSTLVKTVIGLNKPTEGSVERAHNLKVGYVPQKLHLNDALPLRVERFLRLNQNLDKKEIDNVLALVGASKLRNLNMYTLSGGETQRILLASAVLRKPDLLVLDEPVQGIDVTGQFELYSLIVKLKLMLNCGILMVSHDLHLVMAKTDEVICLQHHICCSGTPDLISSHPEYVALFGRQESEQLAWYHHNHDPTLLDSSISSDKHGDHSNA